MAEKEKDRTDTGRTGLYERLVQWITEKTEDRLHKRTERFVNKSVAKYAPNDPDFAKMIEFEIRRRGDGPGLTQDVSEPVVWTGIKTAVALSVAAVGAVFDKNDKKFNWPKKVELGGLIAALVIVTNQTIELFRLIPRYTAGLQGSLRMAIEREKSIKEGHGDPFANQQQRKISEPQAGSTVEQDTQDSAPERKFADGAQKSPAISPTSLREQASRAPQPASRA